MNSTDRVHKAGPPGGAASGSATAAAANLSTQRSCVTCRRRKVKCDKKNPCSNCQRARIECVFPNPGRAARKPRRPADGELLERLKRLEGALQSLGAQVDEETVHKSPESPRSAGGCKEDDDRENFKQWRKVGILKPTESVEDSSTGSPLDAQDMEKKFGRLVVNEGRSRYINNSFWANLEEEVEDLKGMLYIESEDEEDYPTPDSSEPSSHQGFLFGLSSTHVDMLKLHPLRETIPRIWELYKANVDPLVKILHIPTIEPIIMDAKEHLENIPRSLEALLFAIYYGCMMSLLPQECMREFGESQQVLLARYRFALEQALARANFLDSEELVVLQAFVIFLIVLRRNDDARIIWTLTGLVVRIAQTLGVHRDGSHFNGLSPFEIEMRRRLWWQVCILDARASEDHGCDPTITEMQFDTQMPLNVNDSDLTPDMLELPESRKGFTEMTFCLIRFEVANIFRRILYVPPAPRKCITLYASLTLEEKDKWITDCHQRLENTYLQDVDLNVPLYWVAATLSRLVLSKMWLVLYHPYQRLDGGASLPQETKDKLFLTSLEGVEYACLLDNDPRTQQWGWLFRTYVQWHSIAFMLSELRVRTSGPLVERAWRTLECVVRTRFSTSLTDSRRTILWRPLRKLMLSARLARQRQVMTDMQALGIANMGGGPMLMESYPAIDGLLSRGSGSSESSSNTGQMQQNLGSGGNVWLESGNLVTMPGESPSSLSPPEVKLSPGSRRTPSIEPGPSPSRVISQPNLDRSVLGSNSARDIAKVRTAAQDFVTLANHGMDWLVGDMISGDQSTIPDIANIGRQPMANANIIGSPNVDGIGNATPQTGDGMDWGGWDDLVRDAASDSPGVNNGIGMTTWY